MSTIEESTVAELTAKYETAFENSQWNSNDTAYTWKLDNSLNPDIAPNEKCGLVFKADLESRGGFVSAPALQSEGVDTSGYKQEVSYNAQIASASTGTYQSRIADDAVPVGGSTATTASRTDEQRRAARNASKSRKSDTELRRDGVNRLYADNCNGLQRAEVTELYENAWLDKQAEELYKLIEDDVMQAATDAKDDAMECAKNLMTLKGQLNKLLDQFWIDASDRIVGMFPAGYDASALRSPVTPPPTVEELNQREGLRGTTGIASTETLDAFDALAGNGYSPATVNTEADFDPLDPLANIQEQEPVDPELFAALSSELVGEVAMNTNANKTDSSYPDYMTSAEKSYYWDHILMPSDARGELKVVEYMGDVQRPLTGNPTTFPHLYGSLAIALANNAETIVSNMPNQGEVDAFNAGADDSSNTLFAAAKETYNSISVDNKILKPNNYDGNLTTLLFISFGKKAASRIPRYAPGDPSVKTKDWLTNAFYDQIEKALAAISKKAQCIKEAEEDFNEALEKIKEAVKAVKVNEPRLLKFLDNDKIESRARNLAEQNLGDIDLDDVGYGTPAQKSIFKEQCFLLAFAAKLAAYKRYNLDYALANEPLTVSGVHKRLPYASLPGTRQEKFSAKSNFNACLQVSGDPFAFMNKLTQTPNYSDFIDIPHYQLSALQPKIRLYKVIYDTKDENDNDLLETEVEIKFNSSFSQDELLDVFKNKRSRSAGVGLQNFEFTYDGSNPFSVKKSIKAKLSIYASTFSQLFKERLGPTLKIGSKGLLEKGKSQPYRYVDLALKTLDLENENLTKTEEYQKILDENVGLSKLNFRLKAVVGWSLPKGRIPGMNSAQKEKLKRVLANSYVTLNLTPTIHTFNFDQSGAVNFEIDYLAYIDDFFDDRGFNIFADPSGRVGWQRELRRLKMKTYRQKCSSAEEISDLNEKYKDIVTKEINLSLSSLMKGMMDNNKIFYINIDYNKIQNFVASGPYLSYESYMLTPTGDIITNDTDRDARLQATINAALAEATAASNSSTDEDMTSEEYKKEIAAALYASSPASTELSFFYLSDLIDVILENIQLELDYLTDQYSDPKKKIKETTKRPKDKPKLIDVKLWEKRKNDLEKFKNNFKRFRVLLGPVELQHHKKTDSKFVESVNLGDVPISVKYFMEWVTGKVFQKDEIFYSLSAFLNQVMNNLVTNFLNNRKCFFFDIKQKVRVNQAAITSFSPPENEENGTHIDEITQLCIKKDKEMKRLNYGGSPTRLNFSDPVVETYMSAGGIDGMRPLLNVSGRPNDHSRNYAPLSHEINYMTFYASRVNATGVPNRTEDKKKGIFHYLLGQENGILKEIKLQKTQTKGLAEARFEMDGYDGLEQLRVVYDLDIDTYANVNAFPGTYIYVPPGGLDPSWQRYKFTDTDLRSLGIGGYYMIIRSTHSFGPGEANSTIYAKWVNNLESDYPNSEGGSPKSEEAAEPDCAAAADTRLQEFNKR